MAFESVIGFWQKVQADPKLQERVNPADGKVPRLHVGVRQSELVALSEIAKSAGFTATPEEFAAAESVIRFWNQVQTDHTLQQALKPVEKITTTDVAAEEVSRIAHSAGFHFTGKQLNAVTAALIEGGAGHTGGPITGNAYEQSFRTALANGWTAAFRYKIGPGAVAEYM
jgi:hypothetical protein